MLFVPKLKREGWRDFDVSDSINSASGERISIAYPRLIEPLIDRLQLLASNKTDGVVKFDSEQ
jgi:hypothetical protein